MLYEDIYDLSIKFPYEVFDKKGAAKYDKNGKTLTITVPVKPAEKQYVSRSIEEAAVVPELSSADSPDVQAAESPSKRVGASSPTKKDAHKRWVAGADARSSLSDEIAAKAREAVERHKVEVVPTVTVNSTHEFKQPESASPPLDAFIASPAFVGPKRGFCFKLGDGGIGYYADTPLHLRKIEVPAPAQSPLAVSKSDEALLTFKPFPFEYRQTREAIAVLVQIPGISGDSVNIQFSDDGFDVSFAAPTPGGSVNLYSMKLTSACALRKDNCKYDVASLNMVVALTKKEPGFWREDKLISPDKLTTFECAVKGILTQPITILRMSPGSDVLQRACLDLIRGRSAIGAELITASVIDQAAATTSSRKSDCGIGSAPSSVSASKMKFTVGALLDLD